jgi:hypothetical protein
VITIRILQNENSINGISIFSCAQETWGLAFMLQSRTPELHVTPTSKGQQEENEKTRDENINAGVRSFLRKLMSEKYILKHVVSKSVGEIVNSDEEEDEKQQPAKKNTSAKGAKKPSKKRRTKLQQLEQDASADDCEEKEDIDEDIEVLENGRKKKKNASSALRKKNESKKPDEAPAGSSEADLSVSLTEIAGGKKINIMDVTPDDIFATTKAGAKRNQLLKDLKEAQAEVMEARLEKTCEKPKFNHYECLVIRPLMAFIPVVTQGQCHPDRKNGCGPNCFSSTSGGTSDIREEEEASSADENENDADPASRKGKPAKKKQPLCHKSYSSILNSAFRHARNAANKKLHRATQKDFRRKLARNEDLRKRRWTRLMDLRDHHMLSDKGGSPASGLDVTPSSSANKPSSSNSSKKALNAKSSASTPRAVTSNAFKRKKVAASKLHLTSAKRDRKVSSGSSPEEEVHDAEGDPKSPVYSSADEDQQ